MKPIAIVGIACRLPGAPDTDEFWKMICEGRTALGKVPESRLNRKLFYDPKKGVRNKTYTDIAGVIEYPPVDTNKYPISPEYIAEYDTAQLALAQSVIDACRSAGYNPQAFPVSNTGVFFGTTRPGDKAEEIGIRLAMPEIIDDISKMEALKSAVSPEALKTLLSELNQSVCSLLTQPAEGKRPRYYGSGAVELISRLLNLDGPRMIFNSACASSLHSLSQAIMALQLGRIDAAIAGGASYFHSDTLVLFASSQSMTTNRSCPFDEQANGMVVGEGNVVFILKRLEDAMRDNDDIKAVFTGYGIASDGKGKSLWAPRKEGQIEAMRRAYSNGLNPADVDYIEGHATSTALGDATETEAIAAIFSQPLKGRKIPIGSAKGNVGHTLEAAGATGVLKAVLTLMHKHFPPVAGLKNLSTKIPWDSLPLVALKESRPWEAPKENRPRRAGVNSFGIGGLNVHLVLDEYVPEYWKAKLAENKAKPEVKSDTRIAVIGSGCIYPDAYNMDSFAQLLFSGSNGIKAIPEKRWNFNQILENRELESGYPVGQPQAGVIDKYVYDWKKNRIPPKQVENASPMQFMMLDAVNEALAAAGFDFSPAACKRTGVVVGTCFGGHFADQMNIILWLPLIEEHLRIKLHACGVELKQIDKIIDDFANFLHKKMPALLDETGSFTPSALSSRITKSFDLYGGAVAVESESVSSGAALLCCIDQLLSGMNDTMICVSGQQDFGPSILDSLMYEGTWAQDGALSPFDARSNGYVLGEGCGAVILKRYADAVRDGNTIQAVISGIGFGSGESTAMNVEKAMIRSGIEQSFPQFIQADFNGEAGKDAQMVQGISRAKEQFASQSPAVELGSSVNQTGYLATGEGMASILTAIEELNHGKWVKSPNLNNPAAYFARYKNIALPVSEKTVPEDAVVGVCNGEKSCCFVNIHK